MSDTNSGLLRRLSRYYRTSAVILVNTGILLIFINLTVSSVLLTTPGCIVSATYGGQALQKVYPDLNKGEIRDLLNETWARPYDYEPFTQFKERPFVGRYVNVNEAGFRNTKNQGPWPPAHDNFNVFVFGGSTAFGYGVPDHQTVASYLQDFLAATSTHLGEDVKVYNFGRGYYYSTQELMLFQRLLSLGFVPDMAVFVDGLNEFYFHADRPYFTERFETFVQGNVLLVLLEGLPITRAIKMLLYRGDAGPLRNSTDPAQYGDDAAITRAIDTYLRNKDAIETLSLAYGVQPIFIWQPVPTHQYNLRHHLFAKHDFDFGRHDYSRYGYARMAEVIEKSPPGDNFLWCADIQEHVEEPLYVDKTHYSAKGSKLLANHIYGLLKERNFLSQARP